MHRWAGIDEAGYGPNLGPMVMTAVVAESRDDRRPDLWRDLHPQVTRAGEIADALWIDDSKKIHKPGHGLARLEAGLLAGFDAIQAPRPLNARDVMRRLLLPGESAADFELDPWLEHRPPPEIRSAESPDARLGCESWRIVEIRAIVIGPARFNRRLAEARTKAEVHFAAFAELLRWIWSDQIGPAGAARVVSDRHGGRTHYLEPLYSAFPDAWINRGPERRESSEYQINGEDGRSLAVAFKVEADAGDGLVALASMISKLIREYWMEAFNCYWIERMPGLAATAGYPVDAARFRRQIEGIADTPHPGAWWRER